MPDIPSVRKERSLSGGKLIPRLEKRPEAPVRPQQNNPQKPAYAIQKVGLWERFKWSAKHGFRPKYGLKTIRNMEADRVRTFGNQQMTPELEGRLLKRYGKATKKSKLEEKGRQKQYEHYTPENLLMKHPSQFLRTYKIRSDMLQHSENPGVAEPYSGKATGNMQYSLMAPDMGLFKEPGGSQIKEGKKSRKAQGYFQLLPKKHEGQMIPSYGEKAGENISAGFLPMLQTRENIGGQAGEGNVDDFRQGRLKESRLGQSGIALTTEFSGCTLLRQKNALLHLRPGDQGGEALQSKFPRENTFGKLDYGNADQTYAMVRQKPDGRMKVYWQSHFTDKAQTIVGSKYLGR
ncbi:MAG: hypothetical protein MI863_05625 [Desulfobacterales bacterium]|nr:hypothetical protein [Desulfobacterales bacterium]